MAPFTAAQQDNILEVRYGFIVIYSMIIRVGQTGSLEPWSRVIVYYSNLCFPFAKMIIPLAWGIIVAKGQLAIIHYDSALRPQRSCFANPTVYTIAVLLRATLGTFL